MAPTSLTFKVWHGSDWIPRPNVHEIVYRAPDNGELAEPGRRGDTTCTRSQRTQPVSTVPELVIILDDVQTSGAPGLIPLRGGFASEDVLDDTVPRYDRQGRGLSRSMGSKGGSWGPG